MIDTNYAHFETRKSPENEGDRASACLGGKCERCICPASHPMRAKRIISRERTYGAQLFFDVINVPTFFVLFAIVCAY